ncbi:hypothetical protein Tco_1405953 [Tanacetum coccineum]
MEDVLKRRHVVLPDSEDEDAKISSKQGRNLQEEGLDEMVRNMIKDKSEVFKTPTQGKTSGEEDINPTTLEVAKTLSKVASQRSKSVDKGLKKIALGFEEVNTGGLGFSTGSGPRLNSQNRTKEQIQQEETSRRSLRLQTLRKKELPNKSFLDALLAKRLAEEEELTEQQKQRKAQLNFEASILILKKTGIIKAKLEAKQIDKRSTKAQLKRYGEELQTEISKKQRIDNKDVSDTEEEVEAHNEDIQRNLKFTSEDQGLAGGLDDAEGTSATKAEGLQ